MTKDNRFCEFIGMLHIHINSILSAPSEWRKAHKLPTCNPSDWNEIDKLERDFSKRLNSEESALPPILSDTSFLSELELRAQHLSFTTFLEDRLMAEAHLYHRYGVDSMMIENVAGPYFVRGRQPVAIVALMSLLAGRLRTAFPKNRFGTQILACSCDLALSIALRNRFNFIRSEAALFSGTRPEGHVPNTGNLATLYAIRNRWLALGGADNEAPLIYVDIKKKHTYFIDPLEDLNEWLGNLIFQKLEGVVLTGRSTGEAVDENELVISRDYIDKLYNEKRDCIGDLAKPKLIVGSGVNVENLAAITQYADAIIVGSSIKAGGYWENPLDEMRLSAFVDAMH